MSAPTDPGWYYDPEGRYSHQAYWDGERWTGATRRPPDDAAVWGWTLIGFFAGMGFLFVLRADDREISILIADSVLFGVSLLCLGWASVYGNWKSRAQRYGFRLGAGWIVGAFAGSMGIHPLLAVLIIGIVAIYGVLLAGGAFLIGRSAGGIYRRFHTA